MADPQTDSTAVACDHETVTLVPSDDGFPEDGWLCAACSVPFVPLLDGPYITVPRGPLVGVMDTLAAIANERNLLHDDLTALIRAMPPLAPNNGSSQAPS